MSYFPILLSQTSQVFCVPAPPGPPFTPCPTNSSRKENQQNIPGDSECKDTTSQGL